MDFSPAASSYKIPFAAFFADCDHELRPVTSGHRVCLVYNLLQSAGSEKIGGPKFSTQVAQMAELLKSRSAVFGDSPKAVLLGHQDTAANFSLPQLKLHDRPRAESLLQAAQQAGYFACLGLVTHYLQGEMEDDGSYYDYRSGRRQYRRYEEEDTGGGTMGEVYETSTEVSFWSGEGMPDLGDIPLEEDDLITDDEIGTGAPIQQEAEGFTGNAGMTMQYWYHYGAVILWPAAKHWALLSEATVQTRLEWLLYYCRNWENDALNPRKMSRQLIERFLEDDMQGWQYPCKNGRSSTTCWRFLWRWTPHRRTTFCSGKSDKSRTIWPISRSPITETRKCNGLIPRLKRTCLPKKHGKSASYNKVLALSRHMETDAAWQQTTAAVLTRSLPRDYANDVLAVVLLHPDCPDNALAKALYAVCVQELGTRVAQKPVPPADWRRDVPTTGT